MSLNQSKSESQYRKAGAGGRSGGSGQPRNFVGGGGRGGGGSTAPPFSANPPSQSNSRSFKKTNNAQTVQPRGPAGSVNAPESNAAPAVRPSVQNGSHSQPILQAAPSKPNDASTQKSTRPIPRAPSSQSPAMTSDPATPPVPTKGDGGKGFALQFGSISPGLMNGMQVPARTTSAPPNLDEQKRAQAQHDAMRRAGAVPVPSAPSAPKPEVAKKEVAPTPQRAFTEVNADAKVKRDVPTIPAPLAPQAQKVAGLPMGGISMPIPYPQPPVSLQFGGPNPQMQSQGIPTTSLPLPIPMPMQMGNPSQVQQVFMPHHMMQAQGMMHQNQGMGFNPQMGQLPHQLGSMGMNMPPQFSPQPAKYGSARKAVKITHPDTHEELRLDKRNDAHTDGSASRAHHNIPPQPQNLPNYSSPITYYSNAHVGGPAYYAPPSSVPLSNAQTVPVSQAARFTYPATQSPSVMPFISQPSSSVDSAREAHNVVLPASAATVKAGSISVEKERELPKISRPVVQISASRVPKDSQKSIDSNLQKTKPAVEQPKASVSVTGESVAELTASMASASLDSEASSTAVSTDSKKEAVARSDSFKEHQKKPAKKEHTQVSHQVGLQSSLDLPQAVVDAPEKVSSVSPEPKKDHGDPGAGQASIEASSEKLPINRVVPDDISHVDVPLESHVHTSAEAVESGKVTGTSPDHCTEQVPPHDEASSKPQTTVVVDTDSSKLANAEDKNKENAAVKENNLVTDVSEKLPETSSLDKDPSSVSNDGKLSETSSLDSASNKSHSSGTTPKEESTETARPNSSSGSLSKAKPAVRGKKKIKQILQKADAQGSTSDLYMAYKGPEEKKEDSISTEQAESVSVSDLKLDSTEVGQDGASIKEKDDRSKAEPDDWEDAADVSTPKLETGKREYESLGQDVEEAGTAKKYSRDFLLTFSEQFTNLPAGFEITSDVANILVRPNSGSARAVDRQFPSPGRIVDRPSGGSRVDRRGSGMMDPERWNKQQGQFQSPRDMGPDPGYGPMQPGFRPGQGANYGVLRNPRGQQPSAQYPILSAPMQSVQRTDNDRWRNMNFKGLMPSPQAPMIHRAERKYEVGKVTDEEQAKQRKLKGILNKLTPQNFEKLFAQVKEVNIDNVITLTGVISQIFDKALMEPTFCEMYANFCFELSLVLPGLSVDDEKITFKRLLLNKCQEEFERGEREEEEANKEDAEDETKLSAGEREERRIKARRRMLGNIRLIGELFKKRMLTERIMHECIKKLLGQGTNSAEEDIESLCKLMSTIGEMIDRDRAKEHMDGYFGMMERLSNNDKLSSRVRFMLKDSIDLRRNKWQQRRKVEGPKKIDEVHRDAAQERHAQSSRLNRGPSMGGSSGRRGQPPADFGPRGGSSMLQSPSSQMGSFRGPPSQARGAFGMQDARMGERSSFDNRNVSIPLPHRSLGDDSITLGPQGGLAKGMSIRGQPSSLGDASHSHGDSRRPAGGVNAFSSRDVGASSANREHKSVVQNVGRSPAALSTPKRAGEASSAQNSSSEKVWPEERLREKSASAIKEYYSAKDEKELDQCVRELNAPSFYPSVISIWVTDSFERKDKEREMLNNLILNFSRPQDRRLFMPDQLIRGFESVLADLEDTVTDAPRAPDFLGRLFASLILENVVSLTDIARLLFEGGKPSGSLREAGLAGDVLGSTLESIKAERGEAAVKEACGGCDMRLEDFRPPDPVKSRKLELFI